MAQHTCTGCVPIDAKIIDVYIQLLGLKDSTIEAAERAEYAAEQAIGKSPYIGENGDWWEWDDEQGAFIDTGVQAQGSIAVDTSMSSTSTNPVQNKVITAAMNEKQDVVADLTTIRSGAAAGATAYQKPGTGIPSTDMASSVQTSLGKADSAYQKPSGGIPKTDLASGVQTSLGKADTAYQRPASGIPASDIASGVIPDVSGKQDTLVSGTNIKTVNGESILGSGNITAGDPNAVKYVAQTLTDAQKTQACSNIGAAAASALSALETAIAAKYSKPSGGIPETDLASAVQSALSLARTSIQSLANYYSKTEVDALLDAVGSEQYVDVTTLPTASASTLGKIYLVGPDANGFYDRYYTSYDGSTYSWVAAGNTEINLANYATKDELSQLQQKVDDLSTGKYYGYFAQEEDLPEEGVDGFAYVGSTSPYTIYNRLDGVWTSSNVTVNQSPIGNNEDIDQNENGKLQFANRVYNAQQPNGMGYKILRKDATFASQVMETNTIYEIRYDFSLENTTVTIPSGCVLKFGGGRLSNGTVTGNNTSIEAGDNQIFDGVSFDGAWVGDLNACWVGAKKNDNTFDNSSILQAWFDNYCTCFPNIVWPRSNYYFSSEASLSTDKRNKHIVGDGSLFYVNIGTDEASFITLNIGEGFKVSDVRIINSRMTRAYNLSKNYAIHFIGTQQFTVEDVEISYFDRAIYLSDVYYGQVYGRVSLIRNRIGIFMDNLTSSENNTMLFENVRINGCPVEAAKALYPQNTGESEEDYLLRYARCGVDVHGTTFGVKYRGIVMEGVDYGIRYNYVPRSTMATTDGLVIIDGCYFEANTTNDIYIGMGYVINPNNLPNYYANAYVTVYANSCVFHGNNAVNVFVKDCILFIDCVLRGAKVVTSAQFGRTKVFHSDNVIVESDINQITATIEKGFNLEVPSSTGNIYPTTSRQTIVGLERNGVRSVISDSWIDNSTYIQNGSALKRFIPERFSITGLPEARYVYGIQPNTLRFYNGATYVEIPSGSGVKSVMGLSYNEVISSYTIRTDGIELYEFIRRWKAGIEYTGYVNQVFPYKVRSVPSTGLIYMEDHAGVEAVYGFGKKAIDDNTITFAIGKRYLDIETLCVSSYGYSTLRFVMDLVQCGRTYEEMLSSAGSVASYRKAGYILTTALRDAMTPRFNAIIYNSATKQHEIYDGFQWVALTDPFKRYIYNDSGKSIAERATVPDLPNQTYYNAATGIEYKYVISGDKTYGQWVGGIGHILSLTNPNGYDATSNPLDYATELSAGEVVQYDGAFYKWDGAQFVAL